MHRDTGEVAFTQQFVQLSGSQSTLDKDDNLVELQGIEQFVELPVLLGLTELNVILLKTMKSKLSLIIDVDLKRILHEFLAYWSNILSECGAEHHHLLLSWGSAEDILDVPAHVYWDTSANVQLCIYGRFTNLIEHLITLVEDENFNAVESELLFADQSV